MEHVAASCFKNIREAYQEIHLCLLEAFRNSGIFLEYAPQETPTSRKEFQQCFQKPVLFDLLYQGEKIAGGAQKRSKDIFLHQGSIALRRFPQFQKKEGRDFLKKELTACMERHWEIVFEKLPLKPEELKAAEQLAQNKYRSQSWQERF